MQELLTHLVSAIVRHPDEVQVSQFTSEDDQHVTLRLSVNPEDMGIIIGREGSVARALRNMAKVAAIKQNQKVYIDILESGERAQQDEPNSEAAG